MADRIAVTIENDIARVVLTRPDKLNALDLAMFEQLVATAGELAELDDLRAVVLSGEGSSFCAGLDFASFATQLSRGESRLFDREPDRIANLAQRAAWDWRELPVPVIAALHGHVYGGGLQIALGADIRIAAPDARLAILEMRWGLIPDMSGTQTLRDILSFDKALELALTAKAVSGDEAAELGLVTRTDEDPHGAALALAGEIAAQPPGAVKALKKLFRSAWHGDHAEGLALEEAVQRERLASADHQEAVLANLAGR